MPTVLVTRTRSASLQHGERGGGAAVELHRRLREPGARQLFWHCNHYVGQSRETQRHEW